MEVSHDWNIILFILRAVSYRRSPVMTVTMTNSLDIILVCQRLSAVASLSCPVSSWYDLAMLLDLQLFILFCSVAP